MKIGNNDTQLFGIVGLDVVVQLKIESTVKGKRKKASQKLARLKNILLISYLFVVKPLLPKTPEQLKKMLLEQYATYFGKRPFAILTG